MTTLTEQLCPPASVETDDYLTNHLDYYKPTMSQLIYEKEPDVDVTFTFRNRAQQQLSDYVNPDALNAELDAIRERGWSEKELRYLGSLALSSGEPVFRPDYLAHLQTTELPPVTIELNEDLEISTTGSWDTTTFWETTILSKVNELYFENYLTAHNINPADIYDEGDRRLSQKIATLQAHPDIQFADFGTRRHFSFGWQKHVIERLLRECPDNFTGTSNVGLAHNFDLTPIGTFAHEMPMVYAALADARGQDVRASHEQFLTDWYDRYGDDLSTALTDTFGSEFFLSDFSQEQAQQWQAMRHDSGDPFAFGERLLDFYQHYDIDPRTKTVVFSDGLDIDHIVALQSAFGDRVNVRFGWGTTLTNDLGLTPLNIVMKATQARDRLTGQSAYAVKLSDDIGKHTGPEAQVERYQHLFSA